MGKVISVINLKGGVAKTTTTVQIAECLTSEFSKKVLVIDLDPQTNSTIALIDEDKWEELDAKGQTLFQLFNDKLEKTKIFDINTALQRNVSNLHLRGLDLLPSSIRFIDIQDRIGEVSSRTHNTINPQEVLKSAAFDLIKKYDYVLIDCPPNLGYITRNGIEISDYYLIPTIPDTLSTYGIPQIIGAIHELSTARKLPIQCLGLVITKVDSRSNAHARGRQNLPARFARKFTELKLSVPPIFETVMPQANATSEAMEFANAANTFKAKYGRSKSGDRYLNEYVLDLTREFMRHVGI